MPTPEQLNEHGAAALDTTATAAGTFDWLTGAADVAQQTGLRVLPEVAETPLARAGLFTGIAGAPLSMWSMINGGREIANGDTSQGVLDVASGGLGLASSYAGMMNGAAAFGTGVGTAAAAPLALAAGSVGLAAYGNGYATERGWYGHNDDGSNATFFGAMGNGASEGWRDGNRWGRNALGDNWGGRALGWGLGAAAGGADSAGRGVWNFGQAMWGGARRLTGM